MKPLTVDEIFQRVRTKIGPTATEQANVLFEKECLEQAKLELGSTANCGMDFIHKVLGRAADIKAERIAKGEGQ